MYFVDAIAMTGFTLAENSRSTSSQRVALCKTRNYDGIKARENTFQSTKSTVDLVDKNNTGVVVGRCGRTARQETLTGLYPKAEEQKTKSRPALMVVQHIV